MYCKVQLKQLIPLIGRLKEYAVDHNLKSQKTQGTNRYEVDNTAADKLEGELIKGHAKVAVCIQLYYILRICVYH